MSEDQMRAYRGTEPYIFISYAHKDAQRVLPIVERFQRDGYRAWFDEGIEAGSEWAANIAKYLKQSACVIAFLTRNYLDSSNCKDEIEYAKSKSIPTLIIYLDDMRDLPDWFELRHGRTQAVWSGNEKFFDRVYEAGMMQSCRGEGTEPPQTQSLQACRTDGAGAPQAQLPPNIFFRATLSDRDGTLFIYSSDCHSREETVKVDIPEEAWDQFAQRCKQLIAASFPGTLCQQVMIRRTSALDGHMCAPNDGKHYYDKPYRIDFKVSFLRGEGAEDYSARIEIDDNFEVSLFDAKKGEYIFKSMSDDVELSTFGIDEAALRQAAKEMLQFATGRQDVIVANRFRKKVYSDKSGGFYLDYILPDD